MIKISKKTRNKEWQFIDQRDTSLDVSPNTAIAKAIDTGLLTNIESITFIGQGKEALVFYGLDEYDQWAVVKMYKLHTSAHRQKLLHTPFTHPYDVLKEFPNKEYNTLKALEQSNIPAPKPFHLNEFGYSMSLIGDDLGPAPLLSNVNKRLIISPSDMLEDCVDILRDMFIKANYVHGDFSEYNLLFFEDRIYVIDFLQSAHFELNEHVRYGSKSITITQACKILKKDIRNILLYFEKSFRLYADFNEVYEYCISDLKKEIDNSQNSYQEIGLKGEI